MHILKLKNWHAPLFRVNLTTNSILYGMKAICLTEWQRVENYTSHLVCRFCFRLLATSSLLKNVRWLSIKQCIFFKLLLLAHKPLIGLAPQYLCKIVLVKFDNERLLYLKFMNTTSGKRSFEYASCRLWNRLHHCVRMLND